MFVLPQIRKLTSPKTKPAKISPHILEFHNNAVLILSWFIIYDDQIQNPLIQQIRLLTLTSAFKSFDNTFYFLDTITLFPTPPLSLFANTRHRSPSRVMITITTIVTASGHNPSSVHVLRFLQHFLRAPEEPPVRTVSILPDFLQLTLYAHPWYKETAV